MRELRPGHDASGHRYALVAARFNESYVKRLVDAACEVLRGRGVTDESVTLAWVPGSYELPVAAKWLAERGGVDAILAFGVVIRGETEHFRLVSEAASEGLLQVMLDSGLPVLNGVLAAENAEQAAARSGGALGNRGADVALAAIQMVTLRRILAGANS
ncbi:MAG: 6,7-dimethyl-8-ribityllumazine synthase [Candidatus Eisenbacteria bacterium]|uniref:6,7-dimethyl-8-ribityllumazine synthase n=1 Tax=Eiseniibacteriota bacterium TaxID=2212470 RepID=A0A849SHG0_UNCEI|nr:6,7-dimethyl-8-ribityllumazine synthase [Candidatus Eisenbacteria bacterium]